MTKYIKWKHKAHEEGIIGFLILPAESSKVNEELFANAVQNIFISEFQIPKENPEKIIIYLANKSIDYCFSHFFPCAHRNTQTQTVLETSPVMSQRAPKSLSCQWSTPDIHSPSKTTFQYVEVWTKHQFKQECKVGRFVEGSKQRAKYALYAGQLYLFG